MDQRDVTRYIFQRDENKEDRENTGTKETHISPPPQENQFFFLEKNNSKTFQIRCSLAGETV